MPEFIFIDGKKLAFDKFKPEMAQRIYVGQPAKALGRHTGTVMVYVTKAVADFERVARNTHNVALLRTPTYIPIMDNKQVAITDQQLTIGIPMGVYVPIQWNQYNRRFEITTDTLENDDLILEDTVAAPDTQKKVYGTKEELVVEDEGPAVIKV